jgi:hypothetical protein
MATESQKTKLHKLVIFRQILQKIFNFKRDFLKEGNKHLTFLFNIPEIYQIFLVYYLKAQTIVFHESWCHLSSISLLLGVKLRQNNEGF